MPTPEYALRVVVLRVSGGDPWCAEDVSIVDVPTSSVHHLAASHAPLAHALRASRPIAVTSPRAGGWMAELPSSMPRGRVFCSGGRTARILASGGWESVPPLSGSGGAAAAQRILSESRGDVLHVRGAETAGTLEAALNAGGRSIEPLIVYELRDRIAFLEDEVFALSSCDGVAVLAPSCLRVLRALVPDLAALLAESVPALCGPTTASALREAGWRDVRVAPEPTQSALLSLLKPDSVNP